MTLSRGLRAVLVGVAALYALMALGVMALRLPYPFELEWMEGGSWLQLQRLLAGEKLYVAPSLDFIPYIYPPLYYYVAALVAKVVGAGFAPLRLVSLAASVGTTWLIMAFVRRETGAWAPAALAGGLFLATFRHSGAWFDMGRVDPLFLCLFLAGLYLVRFRATWRGWIAAGVVFALSYLTKQLALAMTLPVLAYAFLTHWRRALAFTGAFAAAAGLATLALDAFHGGWYTFYVFETLSRHAIAPETVVGFWTHDMARALGVALAMGVGYLAACWRSGDRDRLLFYGLAGAAMVGGSYVSRLNFGGYDNVLLWADAWIALMFGLAFHAASEAWKLAPRRLVGLSLLCLAQFALLAYNPVKQVPTAADAAAGRALVTRLASLPGDVWVPYHPYLGVMAGKPAHAHGMALVELLWGHGPVVDGLRRDATAAIAERRFGAIVLDAVWFPPELKSAIQAQYAHHGDLFEGPQAFLPVTGMATRPMEIYVPAEAPGAHR